jgi:hypothetical protein
MKKELTLKNTKAFNLPFSILKTACIDGITDVAQSRSNINQTLRLLIDEFLYHKYPLWRINKTVRALRARGLIKMVRSQNGWRYALTENGKHMLVKYEIKQCMIKKHKYWDKKWRVVIFDIREIHRTRRNELRKLLISLGFKLLHKSVWLFPYPCDDIVELAKTAYGVRHNTIYLVCGRFNGDEWFAFDFNIGLAPNG